MNSLTNTDNLFGGILDKKDSIQNKKVLEEKIGKDNSIILVTGVAGFIGSHLAHYFAEKGYNVIGTVRRFEAE